MKTISLIIISSFLSFLSQAGFANSTGQSELCCPVLSANSSLQSQQQVLDQIQSESQAIAISTANPIQDIVKKRMTERTIEEFAARDSMQRESETISIEQLHHLSNKVAQHLNSRLSSDAR